MPKFWAKKITKPQGFTSLREAQLHLNRRFSSLPRRNAMKPGHLHQTPEALLACPAIARRATADEDAHFIRLGSRFIPLSFHCTCEVSPFRNKDGVSAYSAPDGAYNIKKRHSAENALICINSPQILRYKRSPDLRRRKKIA